MGSDEDLLFHSFRAQDRFSTKAPPPPPPNIHAIHVKMERFPFCS
jgi:hypothetical protein